MSSEILADADHKMSRAIEAMDRDLQGVRTGRASTSLVERITVDYYGTQTPLNQLAGISVPEPHQIVIQPWDRGVLGAIEKAITKSEIGLMPNVDGTVVRLNIPPLTEERRKDLVKVVHRRMEEARVEIRDVRRDAADHLKKEERDGEVGRRRGPPPARPLAEDDRSSHRRGRPPRRRQGTGGPRGLVARAPLARADRRATVRPRSGGCGGRIDPCAHRSTGRAAARPARRPAPPRRHHHGRQPALGPLEGPARARGPRRRRRSHPRPAAPCGPPRASRSSRCTPSAARTGRAPTTRSSACSGCSRRAIRSETDELKAQGVRVRLLGRLDELPDETRTSIGQALDATSDGTRLLLNIAFNYAGRTELVDAVRRMIAAGTPPESIDEATVTAALYTAGLPDPDLVIRTGGEQRLSNFLIWQAGLRRVLLLRGPVARFRTGCLRRRPARVRPPSATVRALSRTEVHHRA